MTRQEIVEEMVDYAHWQKEHGDPSVSLENYFLWRTQQLRNMQENQK